MRNTRILVALVTVIAAVGPVWGQDDLASVRKALEAKYALTVTTADKSDIVKAGDVLVLKKSGLVTVDVSSKTPYQNKYVNGRITQSSFTKTSKFFKALPGASTVPGTGTDRTFVTGEKVWLTNIDVTEKGITLNIFTDAYKDTRYQASLVFPFEKGATPGAAQATAMVAEVFDIQPSDDKAAQSSQPAPAAPAGNTAAPATPAAAEAAPPPLAPPPPPPADPKTISLGQTPDQVTANFGPPDKIIKLSTKQIYVYKDMKVTFVGGKVSNVE